MTHNKNYQARKKQQRNISASVFNGLFGAFFVSLFQFRQKRIYKNCRDQPLNMYIECIR